MSIKALESYLEPLKACLQTDGVTEVCINRPGVVFVEEKGCFKRYTAEALEFGWRLIFGVRSLVWYSFLLPGIHFLMLSF